MSKARSERKKILRYTMVALVVVFLISAALLLLNVWESQRSSYQGEAGHMEKDTSIVYNGEEYEPKKNLETFLVLGLDKFEGAGISDSYNNDKQADFLMLFVFDNKAKTCSAIHVNRDTMTDVHILGVDGSRVDTVTQQIALAHTYGNGSDVSCRNTADSVSKLLNGVEVDHYISLTMDSVAVMNDLVGGVEVTVLDDFTAIDETMVEGKTMTLQGEQALHYIRTRQGLEDSTNETRMKRQQQYINALHEKFMTCMASDEDFMVDATLQMSDYMVSNRSVTELQELAEKFDQYEFTGIRSMEGESKLGQAFMEFYPEEDSVNQIVVELFYQPKD